MRSVAGALTILVVVSASACGARTSLFGADDPPMDDEPGIDAGVDTAPPFDAAPPAIDARRDVAPPPEEDGGCVFREGFEKGTSAWTLHTRWFTSPKAHEGNTSLRGFWGSFATGCPVTADATMAKDVDLSTVNAAMLRYFQSGESCTSDTLRVIVSTDQGATWTTAVTPKPLEQAMWQMQELDLGPWVGLPAVRFGFEFSNVCGDICGVDWHIDDVSICAR